MFYKGERGGFQSWRYDVAMDENSWGCGWGFGGPPAQPPRPWCYDPHYRFQIKIEWRPLSTCFEWWAEYLGVETQWHHRKGVHTRVPCGVVVQYRIHSFRRWPVAISFQSSVKNLYDQRLLGFDRWFWQCDHGRAEWQGCWRCAVRSPWRMIASMANRFGGSRWLRADASRASSAGGQS